MMRTRCLPLALTLALGAPLAHADDLMQIYQEARASDPTLAGAEATKLATDENVDQARSQLLPQIGASLSFTRSHGGSNSPSIIGVPDGSGGTNYSHYGVAMPGVDDLLTKANGEPDFDKRIALVQQIER